jgi:hypothetical protein
MGFVSRGVFGGTTAAERAHFMVSFGMLSTLPEPLVINFKRAIALGAHLVDYASRKLINTVNGIYAASRIHFNRAHEYLMHL